MSTQQHKTDRASTQRNESTQRSTASADTKITYDIIDTPVGKILLALSQRGLVRVGFETQGFETLLRALSTGLNQPVQQDPRQLAPIAEQIQQYLAGDSNSFDIDVDLTLSSGFRLQVQQHLPSIAYGQTRSYRDVATEVDNPGAVRAVGSACATNPLPIVVPCHRVLRSDGSLGGYIGGLDIKTFLLALEETNKKTR